MLFAPRSVLALPSDDRYGVGLDGKPVASLTGPGVRVVVLIFAASDCPISNRYVPEIARLSREFSGSNAGPAARIWWVYPNPGDGAEVVLRHNREFSIEENTILDARQSLVALAHATTTPEAAVFVLKGDTLDEVYHGRIDDRYVSLGQERPQPQHRDLEEAIAAALAGRPVSQPAVRAIGCSIVFGRRPGR